MHNRSISLYYQLMPRFEIKENIIAEYYWEPFLHGLAFVGAT